MTDNYKSKDPIGIAEGYHPSENSSPPQDERELVSNIMTVFHEAEQDRKTREYNWSFYNEYLQGNQLIGRDLITNEVIRVRSKASDTGRKPSIDNKLRPINRAFTGKMTRVIPSYEAAPRGDDQDDLDDAQVATSFIEYIADKEKMRVKYKQAQETLGWAGTAVYQLAWDSTAGRTIAWCRQCHYQYRKTQIGVPCPKCTIQFELEAQQKNQERQIMAQALQASEPPPPFEVQQAQPMEKAKEGDIAAYKLSIFEFYPEPSVPDPKLLRYAFRRRAIPVTKARQMFSDKWKLITAESGIYKERTAEMYGGSLRMSATNLREHVYHYEYHEAPTAEFPEGRIVHIINGRLMKTQPNIYYDLLGRLPFFFNWGDRVENELYGEAWISQAWTLQRERNRTRTQIREYRELVVRPRMLIPENSDIGMNELDTTPGRLIPFSPFGGKPAFLDMPNLPDFVYNDLAEMDQSMREKAGVTEQEMNVTTGDPSGRFAAIQEAQSSESVTPLIIENNEEMRELFNGILLLGQKFYSRDRAWTVYGRDRVRSNRWGGINFDPPFDLKMVEVDSLSKNPALRRQEAREYLADGAFLDQRTGIQDMRKYLRLAGLRMPGTGTDIEATERAYAAQIPEMLARGEPFQPQPWDDSQIILEELVKWLRAHRLKSPPQLVAEVGQVYLFYLSNLTMPPLSTSVASGPQMPPGPTAQTQGPTANPAGMGAGPLPTGGQGNSAAKPAQQSTVAPSAAQTVQAADRQGERLAKGSKPHEG